MRFGSAVRARFGHVLVLSWCCSLACDPKAGFESTANSIDPNEKSYVDGPGSLLVAGPYNTVGIDFDQDTGVHLLSRRRDDSGASLTLFGQNAENGCQIAPDVVTWFPSRPGTEPTRLLPYFSARNPDGSGSLGFSSVDCQLEPYTLDNVQPLTDPEIDHGFLVRQNGALVLADPWAGTTQAIVSALQRVIRVGTQFLVWGDGQLIAFDSGLNELGRYGTHVVAVTDLDYGAAFAVEDDNGLHELIPNFDTLSYAFNPIDPDACALSTPSAIISWVVVHSPCSDPHLVGEGIDPTGVANVTRLPFSAQGDSRSALIARSISGDLDSTSDLALFYLDSVDATSGLGTLHVAQPGGAPLELGQNASLSFASLLEAGSDFDGLGFVDVSQSVGRLLRFRWDGSSETVAEGVDSNATVPGILANFTGSVGDLYGLDAHGDTLLEESGVPPFNTTLRSNDASWSLAIAHFDGVSGDLQLKQSVDGADQTTAQRVPLNQYQFMNIVPLPGFAYLADYDESAFVGTLYVQNLSLGSTMVVAKNVSDFVATDYPLPGILYSVPIGSNAGLWFARAK
ncbi:MAG TPA: hypothetical protein VHV51_15360 [Polyangiaceae bacterium]|jgi:hypothetical protein|nr:hypothetical protein [Polyangiaceae bacterium]